MRKILLVLLGCLLLTSVSGQGVVFMENPVWKEALKAAKEQKKLLFIDCYTVWCGPCQGLIRNVFPQKEMGDFYNKHFVNVKYDMEKPNGENFLKIYPGSVLAYPTLLFIDPVTEKIVHKFVGSRPVAEMISEARKSIEGGGAVELQARFDKGERSFEFMKEYIRSLEKSVKHRIQVVEVIDRYLAENDTLKNLMTQEKWEFYSNYLWDIRGKYVQYIMANRLRMDRLKFVDRKKLDEDLAYCLQLATGRLTEISLDKDTQRLSLVQDSVAHRLLRVSLKQLPDQPGREEWLAKVLVYEHLIHRDWMKAYETVKMAAAFEYRSLVNYQWNVYNYIVQETSDRAMLERIYEDLKAGQKNGSRRFINHNFYGRIAVVADKLGLTEEAEAARKESARISAASQKAKEDAKEIIKKHK